MPSDLVLTLTSRCAQVVTANPARTEPIPLLDNLLSVVGELQPDQTSKWFSKQLSTLVRLRAALLLTNLDPLLAKAINGGLPFGQTGFADFQTQEDLPTILRRAEACWASRSEALDESINLEPLFSASGLIFNHNVSSIFVGLIYRSRIARDLFWNWLKQNSELWSSPHICRPLHAYLDSYTEEQPEDLSEEDEGILAEVCSAVWRQAFEDMSGNHDPSSLSCCQLFLQHSRFKKIQFAETARAVVDSFP